MNSEITYDLLVLGGGPAGYAAAIRAGQLGKKAIVVEMERAGGTCLNWGCIPSKALLKSAETYQNALKMDDFGISCENVQYDFEKIIQRSRKVADQMGGGIEYLFKKNKVDYMVGKGMVHAPGMVEIIEGDQKGSYLKAHKILVATGCKARALEEVVVDGERVMTSREALVMKKQPTSIAIMGAGAIGAEFAYFLNSFGTKVILLEMLPNILPVEDAEVSATLLKSFQSQGIDCRVNTRVDDIKVNKDSVTLTTTTGDQEEVLEVESLLLAIGVVPNLDSALSPKLKLDLHKGYLKVDENYQTSLPQVFMRAGDVVGPTLAWLMWRPSVRCRQLMVCLGMPSQFPVDCIPRLYLLPTTGCQHWADRGKGQGRGSRLQGRQISFRCIRQGGGGQPPRRICENYRWREIWGDLRCTYYWIGRHRADHRIWIGDEAGSYSR